MCAGMEKITFKQYLDSKQKLREAIELTPVSIVQYTVRKYCTLALGESSEDRVNVSLKPKQGIIVEWRYDDIDNPTINYIRLEGVDKVDAEDQLNTFWRGEKLTKWLNRYTIRNDQNGF